MKEKLSPYMQGNYVYDSEGNIVEIPSNCTYEDSKKYNPIPLTEKIAVDLGFEKTHLKNSYSDRLFVLESFWLTIGDYSNFGTDNDFDESIVCWENVYVHDIQNAYFIFSGGNRLELQTIHDKILKILVNNTTTEERYIGGGDGPMVIVFKDSEDAKMESFLSEIANQIANEISES